MKYLVLYLDEVRVDGNGFEYLDRDGDWSRTIGEATLEVATWKEFEKKTEAIAFAREHNGSIVEAFEFDIKKKEK